MKNKHILADDNIKKLLIKLSLPATTGMFVMALYNIVDTFFVGRGVGSLAIAGLSIVFPIQMIVMALGLLFGIGGASVISRRLGEGKKKEADRVFGTVIFSAIIISIIITILGIIFKNQILSVFGVSENIYPYANDYFEIIIFASILFVLAMTSNNIIRAEGHAEVAMRTMIIGAVLNMLIDPIFIFVFKMGVRGAAFATVISQSISVIYVFFFFASKKSSLKIKVKNLRFHFPILKEVLGIGMSSFTRNMAGSFVFALINNTLGNYGGDIAIAAYGIVQRILRFLIMPMIGIAQGLQPIVGFNYGAKRFDKVHLANKLAIYFSTGMSVFSFTIIMLFSKQLMMIFTNNTELIEMGAFAMKVMVIALPLLGFQVVGTTAFQAVGKVMPSLILSLSREVLLLPPLVIILSKNFGMNGIWFSVPLADTLAFILTIFMYLKLRSELKLNKSN